MSTTQVLPQSFSVEAYPLTLVTADAPHNVTTPSVVTNLGPRAARLDHGTSGVIAPRSSSILQHAAVTGDLLAVIGLPDRELPAAGFTDGWHNFYGGEPVLLRSPSVDAGVVDLRLRDVLQRPDAPTGSWSFAVRINLWFSPAGSDCGIHRRHDFLEVHTQISGLGHMEKFHTDHHGSLYEDQPMAPGTTNPVPFCSSTDGSTFHYPWHQYRAETDCVWLAVEYHRISA